MTISPERIERPKVAVQKALGCRMGDTCGSSGDDLCLCAKVAIAALTADAPAIEGARAEEREAIAKAIQHFRALHKRYKDQRRSHWTPSEAQNEACENKLWATICFLRDYLDRLPSPCEAVKRSDDWICDRCESLWTFTLEETGFRPSSCVSRSRTGGWHKLSETMPNVGRKFVAVHSDGSGATMFYRHDDGFIDAEGFDTTEAHVDLAFHLAGYDRWTYLPSDLEFWCEARSEDPYCLPASPSIRSEETK